MRKIISETGKIFIEEEDNVFYHGSLLPFVDQGEEGRVYRFLDQALKIYYKVPRKKVAEEEILKQLQTIKLNRIITPTELLYEYTDHKNIGYLTEFKEKVQGSVYTYSKEKLLTECSYLQADFSVLGKEKIAIDDLRESNYISNEEEMCLIDFGDYYHANINTETANNRKFCEFFLYHILFPRIKYYGVQHNLSEKEITGIFRKMRYDLLNTQHNLFLYLEKNLSMEENLDDYSQKIINKRL